MDVRASSHNDRGAASSRADGSWLDEWLDHALEETFPASDPISTPPDPALAVESRTPPSPSSRSARQRT